MSTGFVTSRKDTGPLLEGATGKWEVVIGMEVHAQVHSRAKLFSGASTEFGAEPNAHVSFVDAAMPGMLPVINRYCVEQAVRTGLGLKAKINKRSTFDRKNYFYPDLPAGYQISQYKDPIVGEGVVIVDMPGGKSIPVGIERLHLEQDAGKSLHDQHPDQSFVDLNRSGVALMEIVSRPDLRSSEEAAAYLKKLRAILRYLGTCDGNMDEGSMRADVNVSVRKVGGPLGTRCEIKNVSSMRFVAAAVEYERAQGISGVPVSVEDVSGETSQANAYAIGLGPSRRVVLWSTMVDGTFSDGSVRVVLAHEIAHHSSDHLPKGIAWFALFALPSAWLLMRLTRRRGGMGTPGAVPLALLAVAVLQLALAPAQNWISRRMEAEADWKALQTTRDPGSARGLFVGFGRTSLGDPDPPGWAHLLLDTHPTLAQRVAMAEAWRRRQP